MYLSIGQAAASPWKLALVRIDAVPGYVDRPAAEVVHRRVGEKALRNLKLTAAGYGSSVLAERGRLLAVGMGEQLLATLRKQHWTGGQPKEQENQRTAQAPIACGMSMSKRGGKAKGFPKSRANQRILRADQAGQDGWSVKEIPARANG